MGRGSADAFLFKVQGDFEPDVEDVGYPVARPLRLDVGGLKRPAAVLEAAGERKAVADLFGNLIEKTRLVHVGDPNKESANYADSKVRLQAGAPNDLDGATRILEREPGRLPLSAIEHQRFVWSETHFAARDSARLAPEVAAQQDFSRGQFDAAGFVREVQRDHRVAARRLASEHEAVRGRIVNDADSSRGQCGRCAARADGAPVKRQHRI